MSTIDPIFLAQLEGAKRGLLAKWGAAPTVDGTGREMDVRAYTWAKTFSDEAVERGALQWRHLLIEATTEALATTDVAQLETRLAEVAAVAAWWAEQIARRTAEPPADAGEHRDHTHGDVLSPRAAS